MSRLWAVQSPRLASLLTVCVCVCGCVCLYACTCVCREGIHVCMCVRKIVCVVSIGKVWDHVPSRWGD